MQWMMLSCKLCNWRPIEVYVRCCDPRHQMNTEWLSTLEVQPEMTFWIWKQGNLNPRWQEIFNLSWHLLNSMDSNVGAEQRFWGLETMFLMKLCSSTRHICFYRMLTQITSRQRTESYWYDQRCLFDADLEGASQQATRKREPGPWIKVQLVWHQLKA